MSAAAPSRVAVLGATGTVGRAALDVIGRHGDVVWGLAAHRDTQGMAALCRVHRPAVAAMADEAAAAELAGLLAGGPTTVSAGDAAVDAIAAGEADTVVAAICGAAGVASTHAAAAAGKRVLLANKEALVTAGEPLLATCAAHGGELVPVDSEHGALLELLHLARDRREHVRRVWLTASGGPFRERADLDDVTPAMAAAHPVWRMGTKISIDSATLMNKGLEVIEACVLFGFTPDQVGVVIHPQSVVHAIVEFADGGCVAQCGPPDMRAALARALAWPHAHRLDYGRLDWQALGALEFGPPDLERFPCLRLAREALASGHNAPAVLNAANEVAVAAFAGGGLSFTDIPTVVGRTLDELPAPGGAGMAGALAAAAAARAVAGSHVRRLAC